VGDLHANSMSVIGWRFAYGFNDLLKLHAILLPRIMISWRFVYELNDLLKLHAKLPPRIVIGWRFA